MMYVAIATFLGARLGHCIFYDWDYFSVHPLEMILPVRFNPEFQFIGYRGLASHGAAIGILISLWYYSKKVSKKSMFWALDRVVVPVALGAFFVRMGNLMNSEIIGIPTTLPWGFSFVNAGVENPELPRHPAQLYEAICYLISFFILMYLYWRTNLKKRMGFIFGSFLILIFTSRFFIEFAKEVQEPWEIGMALNMGQLLSIPFVIWGVFMLWYSKKLPDIGTIKPKANKK